MKEIRFLLLLIFLVSCSSVKYVTVPMTKPPEIYKPNIINTEKDFLNEYKRSLMKISEWQNWYNIQTNRY
ncbi:hypothetical protein BHAMNSH16_07540 [Brachyspira hampsonii]|uniref:Lipoprotein n=1 Tax=Brachyspira hampsonii TaxID=1287055 RepID=A0AAC9TT74_9SPIR|nr:hypothetical protein [Brachyspira hampsonii]ASJ21498.1 hypothetical protein BHAMNSH16_07540 [Brachyspira hampsonii]MBW5381055.1 hypothetical protein [Brachyspira hampsonii]MBW5409103.1 hypothetical protein [Brachyspira hampsonii]OEJ18000.1 hypothetical protein A9496_09345 [Brachyspira hampsonii]